MLLLWGFSEDDIGNILRATRSREKLKRRPGYVWRTISRTALTKTTPLDSSLGQSLVENANEDGRSLVNESTMIKTKVSLLLRGGTATVSELVDKGMIDWRNAKRKSVKKRTRRALKIFEEAGYVSKTDEGPVTLWHHEGLDELKLPHET
jgi:hypothetical protein